MSVLFFQTIMVSLLSLLFIVPVQASSGVVISDQCEIIEAKRFNEQEAKRLNDRPLPNCAPLHVHGAPSFDDEIVSTTFKNFLVSLIASFTSLIDEESFSGRLGPLPGHPNQSDIGGLSFVWEDLQVQSKPIDGARGEQFQATGEFAIDTREYREAHTLLFEGGVQKTLASEAKMSVGMNLYVNSTPLLLNFLSTGFSESCSRVRPQVGPGAARMSDKEKAQLQIQTKICQSLDTNQYSGRPTAILQEMVLRWKQSLVETLTAIHSQNQNAFVSPRCDEIKSIPAYADVVSSYCEDSFDEIIAVIDQSLRIDNTGESLAISLQMAEVNRQLGDRFPGFFGDLKLDVITIDRFDMQVNDKDFEISFNAILLQQTDRFTGGLKAGVAQLDRVNSPAVARDVGYGAGAAVFGYLKTKVPWLPSYRSKGGAIVTSAGSAAKGIIRQGLGTLLGRGGDDEEE